MQSWFKYSLAFFGLVLLLTGFIYVLGPASTREAAMSGETQTGQLLNPNHTLVSRGEPQPASATADSTSETTTETQSGTTTAAKEKSGDAKAAAATDAKAAAPAKDGAAKVPTPTASPAHDAHKGH